MKESPPSLSSDPFKKEYELKIKNYIWNSKVLNVAYWNSKDFFCTAKRILERLAIQTSSSFQNLIGLYS